MIWYDNLYISNKIKINADKLKKKIQKKSFAIVKNWYVITVSSMKDGQLDIISLRQWYLLPKSNKELYVIGVASSESDAIELMIQILQDINEITLNYKIKEFFIEKFNQQTEGEKLL